MNKNFSFLFSAYLISSIGDWLYKLALPLAVYEITGSPVSMALSYALVFLPFLIVSPFGGVIADMADRKTTLVFGDLASFIFTASLAIIAVFSEHISIWFYLLVFLAACVSPIHHPAFQSVLPQLVKNRYLPRANSLISTIDNITMLCGPIIGGLIIAAIGAKEALYINATTFFVSSILISLINKKYYYKSEDTKEKKESIFESLKVGFQYAWGHKVLKYGSILFMGTNFAINLFIANFVYYLANILKLSSFMIGFVYGVSGIGAIIGSLMAPYFIKRYESGFLIALYTILAGIATIPLIFLKEPILVAVIWGVVLALGSANVVTYFTLRQKVVPSQYLGRAVAITRLISYSSIPIASIFGGLLLNMTNITTIITACAVIRIIVGVVAYYSPLNDMLHNEK